MESDRSRPLPKGGKGLKIDVLGAGAMGCLFGALLSRANEVRLVAPNRAKLKTLKDRGVTVLEPDGTSFTAFPGLRTPEDGSGGPPDLLLIFVKSAAEKEALAAVSPTLGPDTALLTLQNGMGHEKAMGEIAPPERILLGATQHNASLQSVGTVRHGGAGSTQLGALAGNGELARAAAAAFAAAGIETAVSADVRAVIWRKLFMNASASALTGVFRCPLGDVAENPHIWKLCRALIGEAVAVAKADGHVFDEGEIAGEIYGHLVRSKGAITSVYADLEAGRRTEVDAITGAVAGLGRKLGVRVPVSETVAEIIRAMEERKQRNGSSI